MLVLAIDTAAEFGSIALVEGDETREEVLLHAPEGFSGILFAQIEMLLGRQGVSLKDVDLFAAASGPGSFTGVRVGLSAMKGLAEIGAKPAAAVSNLEAIASFAESSLLRAALIDARRGEVYAALFDAEGRPVIEESVLPFPRFLAAVEPYDFEWIAGDFEPFRAAVAGTRFAELPVTTAPRALAAAIARIAIRRRAQDPAAIEANYVRRSDAELLWKS